MNVRALIRQQPWRLLPDFIFYLSILASLAWPTIIWLAAPITLASGLLVLTNSWHLVHQPHLSWSQLSTLLLPWLCLQQRYHQQAIDWQPKQFSVPGRFTVIGVLIALTLLVHSGQMLKWLDQSLAPLDQTASAQLQRSLVLSGASFATARAIDRGIAFVAETEVSVGVASFKPGQLMKPLQDMAVRYSDLMVLAMASVGTQLLLLEFGRLTGLPILLFAAGISALAYFFGPQRWQPVSRLCLRGFLVIALLARVAVPVMAVGITELSNLVLEPQRLEAQQELQVATVGLESLPEHQDPEQGFLNWMRHQAGRASDIASSVRAFSDSMVERFVQLIVVYTIQTVVFPLLSLWLLWRLGKAFVWPEPLLIAAKARGLS